MSRIIQYLFFGDWHVSLRLIAPGFTQVAAWISDPPLPQRHSSPSRGSTVIYLTSPLQWAMSCFQSLSFSTVLLQDPCLSSRFLKLRFVCLFLAALDLVAAHGLFSSGDTGLSSWRLLSLGNRGSGEPRLRWLWRTGSVAPRHVKSS